ncbi:MAG: nitroreductase family protein [Desulfovibrio sp.]
MTTMHHEAKATVSNIMYIRGIPFRCPETAKDKQATAAPDAVKESAPASAVAPAEAKTAKAAIAAPATPAFVPSNVLARFGTACGCRAGISRAESESQAKIVRSRRSVRVFADRRLTMRELRDLISSVANGLTDGRTDPARFIIVEAPRTMARVTGLAARWLRQEGILADGVGPDADADAGRIVFGGAPHLAVAYGKSGSAKAAEDCALAMARLEWAGTAMGLGCCFAGEIVRAAAGSSELAAAMSVPTGHTVYAALFLGYPGFAPQQPETTPGVRIIWL